MASKTGGRADPELEAINTVLGALDGLEGESIQRVLDYVIGRLSLGRSVAVSGPATIVGTGHVTPSPTNPPGRQVSIRDLKDEKKPTSSNQMAALVAFYLSEVAQGDERKSSINGGDLQKYFKQAGFRLPNRVAMALPNAAAAGYFDAVGNGMYRLNPVGYNLVAHGLPRGGGQSGSTGKAKNK